VVVANSTIVWVASFAVSREFVPDGNSQRLVIIEERESKDCGFRRGFAEFDSKNDLVLDRASADGRSTVSSRQRTSTSREQPYAFSRFLTEVERGNVKEVTIADSDVKGTLSTGEHFRTVMPMVSDLINMLPRQVTITGEKPSRVHGSRRWFHWAPFLS
jgi:hypothetical protein